MNTIAPKKSLGQTFLSDKNVLRRFIELSNIKDAFVVEIGPGLGFITEQLLKQVKHLIAVEKDSRLLSTLQKKFAPMKDRLTLIEGDALEFDTLPLTKKDLPDDYSLSLVSNLPFNIASRFLWETAIHPRFTSLNVIVQKEVGSKILAQAGTKEYGPLSIHMQQLAEKLDAFPIKRTCFWPKPKVDAMALFIQLRSTRNYNKNFSYFVKKCFSQKRKTLKANLALFYPKESILEILEKERLPKLCRPQDLSIEDFQRVHPHFTSF